MPGTALRFSRDSSRIAIRQDNQMVLYTLSPSDSFIDEMQSIDTVRFTPDGYWLLTGGRQGVLVYATNPLAYKGSLGLDDCGPVAWHPSGDELATFGIFTHLAHWPVREEPSTQGLILHPPKAVILNQWPAYSLGLKHLEFICLARAIGTLFLATKQHNKHKESKTRSMK